MMGYGFDIMNKLIILVGGFLIGFGISLMIGPAFYTDTGRKCMEMYEVPEDISECLWILNHESMQ
jgi:hypothetical protein